METETEDLFGSCWSCARSITMMTTVRLIGQSPSSFNNLLSFIYWLSPSPFELCMSILLIRVFHLLSHSIVFDDIHVGKSTRHPISRRIRLCWWQSCCTSFTIPRVRLHSHDARFPIRVKGQRKWRRKRTVKIANRRRIYDLILSNVDLQAPRLKDLAVYKF